MKPVTQRRSTPPVTLCLAAGLLALAAAQAEGHGRCGQRGVVIGPRVVGHTVLAPRTFDRSLGLPPSGFYSGHGVAAQPVVYTAPYYHGRPILDPDDPYTPEIALEPAWAPAPAPAPQIIVIQMPAPAPAPAPIPAAPPVAAPAYEPPRSNPNARPATGAEPGAVYLWLAQPEAAVFLDGEALGTGEEIAGAGEPLELAAGVHTLVARHPDFGAERLVFSVPAGDEILIEVNLMGDRGGRKARIRTAWEVAPRLRLLGLSPD